jgi:hypothetical protein
MVYLGGPLNRRRQQLRLHDAPPGYRPPRIPVKNRKKKERQAQELIRVPTVVLVLAAAATVVLVLVMAATYH